MAPNAATIRQTRTTCTRTLVHYIGVYLRSLQLTNYRNFRRLVVELPDGPILVVADNAQGKSNLLESVEVLATTKSARAGSDRELLNWGVLDPSNEEISRAERFARVSAAVVRDTSETRADIVLCPADADNGASPITKAYRVNGSPKRASDFVGKVTVVTFSPEEVALVSGSPGLRRRHLDVTNAQLSPRYLRALQRYNRVLLQRNKLLRQSRFEGAALSSLSVWDAELVQSGAILVLDRARCLSGVAGLADRWFTELGGWGHLDLQYRPSVAHEFSSAADDDQTEETTLTSIRADFEAALAGVAIRERGAGVSLVGPHRDDLGFLLDGADLNTFGSRGQQRLAALSLKLAELEWLTEKGGSRPVLLLDDVLSELDDGRQRAVLHAVASAGQTFLTTTRLDSSAQDLLADAPTIRLRAGALADGDIPCSSPAAVSLS